MRLRQLIRKKNRILGPAFLFALLFYFLLPLSLMFIPDIMTRPSLFYGIPWAWLYAFLQIPMTWLLCSFYHLIAGKVEKEMDTVEKEVMH
ncbi:DUF485 domain-containing protein [Bacillus kwashiorkori]|uniref:DUF485 domain-containing protein n=1 Tax=Bacillus kwashiorkori TaxID=1522318 RepID=UPI001EF07AF5|nr:DUF485 domain-containing protein [Bacillus kwashiorkori]